MLDDKPALIFHGHFYQPPRENPWTERIEKEPAAAPFHDWNERIHAECYRANAFARILDRFERVSTIVNNYSLISFNIGPTLLSWLCAAKPLTARRILEADQKSVLRCGGHGNAIAQAYSHPILPLVNERDARTQIHWGLREFEFRFGRKSEGLWLPETACNARILGYLIDAGVKFTILAPEQASRIRRFGETEWTPVSPGSLDSSKPYRFFHPDGSDRFLDIFFYDATVARAIAFEGALHSSQGLLDRSERALKGSARLVHAATDGESYGHHSKFGDRCLAFALSSEAPRRGFAVTNYGEFLEAFPPEEEVEVEEGPEGEGTSWSCAHGVGRWRRDCGCQTGGREGWTQAWRAPLREALLFLRDQAAAVFEDLGGSLFRDPWAARNAYIERILSPERPAAPFLESLTPRTLGASDRVRALSLLETQRFSLLMFTSCGWFFNDLAGIETVQVLKYAGRLLDELAELGVRPAEKEFLERLSEALSNQPGRGTGADIYRAAVLPSRVLPGHVASSVSLTRLVDMSEERGKAAGYRFEIRDVTDRRSGRFHIVTARVLLHAVMTERPFDFAAAAIHLGGADFYCYLRAFTGEREFERAVRKLDAEFLSASMPSIFGFLHEEFGPDAHGLEHIPSETRTVLFDMVFSDLMESLARQYIRIYEDNRRVIEMLFRGGFEMPALLRLAAEFALGWRFEKAVLEQAASLDPQAYRHARVILDEADRYGFHISREKVKARFERMLGESVKKALTKPSRENEEQALSTLELARTLGVPVDVSEVQEALFERAVTSEMSFGLRQLASGLGFSMEP